MKLSNSGPRALNCSTRLGNEFGRLDSKVDFGLAEGTERGVYRIRSKTIGPNGCGRRGLGDETIPDHRFILPLVR